MNADLKEFAGVLLLTDREYRVFKMLGQCMTSSEIAHSMGIHRDTVSKYYERIMNKLVLDGWRQIFRLSVRYDYMRLKRVANVPPPTPYKFVSPNELAEAEIQALPASRNGHSLLADRLTQPKG